MAIPTPNPCLTIVRVDPARYRPAFLSVLRGDRRRRTLPEWATDKGAVALINASMYQDDDRSTGLFVSSGDVLTGADNPKFGGFFAFDPVDPKLPPLAAFGRECAGFDVDRVRRDYKSVVQNYRLLDCEGKPIAWKDEKSYSAAAFGLDDRGRVVLLHARAPLRMLDFAAAIAAPELGIRSAFYVEGGPEASLYARGSGRIVQEIGSYETGFKENDDNHDFWPLPNVLAFFPR